KARRCKAGTVKPHSILHNLTSFADVRTFVDLMGYSSWWFEYNHSRFWWSGNYLESVKNGEAPINARAISERKARHAYKARFSNTIGTSTQRKGGYCSWSTTTLQTKYRGSS